MGAHWNRPLFALVLVVAFTTYALIPPTDTEPREGRVLVFLALENIGPGETHERPFRVIDFYDTMELSYNITAAAHVRASVTGPDGNRHEATADPENDLLTLIVAKPPTGSWTFHVRTLQQPDAQGYVVSGNFTMLGFGGTLRPA